MRTMSASKDSVWLRNSAWGDEVDKEEQAGKLQAPEDSSFPSLQAAVKQDPKKGKKGHKLTLSAFLGSGSSATEGATDAAILFGLPKSSAARPESKEPGERQLGGAFKDYGAGGYRRGYDRDEHEAPTRAPQPPSRADEDNDWVAHKKFVPSDSANSHSFTGSAYGGGSSYRNDRRFEDPPRPYSPRHPPGSPGSGPASPSGHRSGFNFSGPSRADAEERWSHISPVSSPKPAALSSPGSTERPRERPRLSLAPRTLPLDGQPAAALSPRSPLQDGATQATDQPQQQVRSPKPNPFGGARPREDVLKAKGIDYHKEELKLEHGEVIRDKAPEEVALEREVERLRQQLEGLKHSTTTSGLQAELDAKERCLYKLQAELDDAVRYRKPVWSDDRRAPFSPPPLNTRGYEHGGYPPYRSGGSYSTSPRSPQPPPPPSPPSQQQVRSSKPSPFGGAQPREEVLKAKGIDYHKEELKWEHGEVIRDKAPEEAALEREVESMRKQLDGLRQSGDDDARKHLQAELDAKERRLYKLQAELDDQVRFKKPAWSSDHRGPPPPPLDARSPERGNCASYRSGAYPRSPRQE